MLHSTVMFFAYSWECFYFIFIFVKVTVMMYSDFENAKTSRTKICKTALEPKSIGDVLTVSLL